MPPHAGVRLLPLRVVHPFSNFVRQHACITGPAENRTRKIEFPLSHKSLPGIGNYAGCGIVLAKDAAVKLLMLFAAPSEMTDL